MKFGSLKNLATFIGSGCTPSRKNISYWNNADVPWLKTEQLGEYKITCTNECVSQKAVDECNLRIYPENTISIAMYSEGKTRGRVSLLGIPMATNQACCNVEIDTEKINLLYVYHYLRGQYENLRQLSADVRKNLNSDDIKNFPIRHPEDRETQDKIVALLGALDDKIALNKKINATLEAIAKTLYDYWFVQFDFPDENGKPYKTSGGKMIYSSEFGCDIPAGWEIKTLGDLLTENTTLFNQQTIEPTIDLSVMPSSSISLNELSSSEMFSTNLFNMKEGEILFGSIRPYLKKAGIAPCNGVVVGTVYSYQSKKELDYTFALFTVCCDKFFDYAVKVSTGTRMPIIKSENILSYKIAYSEDVVRLFDMPNLKRTICKNVQENHRLATLRDWLLPILMNGQTTFDEI